MDCNINFLLLLCPSPECGGDTLLLFGEQDLTPLIGEPFSSSISGILSSPTVCNCLLSAAVFIPTLNGFSFPNLWLDDADDPMARKDRGGLPFEELIIEIDCLLLYIIYVIRHLSGGSGME